MSIENKNVLLVSFILKLISFFSLLESTSDKVEIDDECSDSEEDETEMITDDGFESENI